MIIDRPEHNLLLSCARVCSDKERAHSIVRCVREGIDWDYLLQTAGAHGMTSMLYQHLNTIGREAVPSPVLERLYNHFQKSAKTNLFYTAELFKILNLFDENGIPAIPFKGPVLSLSLYENPALREFSDLDILVRKQDVFKALSLLTQIGYENPYNHSPAIEARILEQQNNCYIGKSGSGSLIEIHWSLLPGYLGVSLPMERWWERTIDICVQSRQVRSLQNEDLLLALCIHGSKHMWQSLMWIVDIVQFLDKYPNLNWGILVNPQVHPDLRRILSVGLIVSSELLGAVLPQNVLETCRQDSGALELAGEAQRMLFQQSGMPILRLRLFQLRLRSKWVDRAGFLFRFVFWPGRDDWKVDLPWYLSPLYYVLRPIRLFRRYILK